MHTDMNDELRSADMVRLTSGQLDQLVFDGPHRCCTGCKE